MPPNERKASHGQISYLRELANAMGVNVPKVRTAAQASRAIDQLKDDRDRRQVQHHEVDHVRQVRLPVKRVR